MTRVPNPRPLRKRNSEGKRAKVIPIRRAASVRSSALAPRRRRAIRLLMGTLALGLATAVAARVYLYRTTIVPPADLAGANDLELKVLDLVNQERVGTGKPPLALAPRLAVVARGHSYDMAIRNYFAHDTPEGSDPSQRATGAGISFRALGENIYMERRADASGLPARAVRGWLRNRHHRANMLSDRFIMTGVGIARAADGSLFVTQEFIR